MVASKKGPFPIIWNIVLWDLYNLSFLGYTQIRNPFSCYMVFFFQCASLVRKAVSLDSYLNLGFLMGLCTNFAHDLRF